MKYLKTFIAAAILATIELGAAEPVDSLDLPTGKTDWVDPVHATPVGTDYVLYPTPSRGENTQGSCLVYLPDGYGIDAGKRYPVVYYLHGGTGNQREAAWLIERVDRAIRQGSMEPLIVVSPQALPIGWYVNANQSDPKVISGPIEDVIIRDLIPYIDSNYQTIADASGRGVEGFSMGGRGALALAFAHPDTFGAVSSVAGAVVDWEEEPLSRALECTFGDISDPFSKLYFDSWHPKTFACQNASRIIGSGMKVRMFVGDRDRLYEENGVGITGRFHDLLTRLGIPHSFTIVPGADHNPREIFDDSVNRYDVTFWDDAFSRPQTAATPPEISDFISTHFPATTITRLEILPEEKGDHYLVTLSDSTVLKFNEHFKWIMAENTSAGVSQSLWHAGILDYFRSLGALPVITRIKKVPRVGYAVTLADGRQLTFDTKGQLIPA